MAPSVTTILTVARTGSRVVCFLIRPAHKGPGNLRELGYDPWLTPDGSEGLRRRASRLARRGAGLGKLALQGVLGAVVVLPLLLIFGVLFALGFDPAGWLLGLTLLLAVLGLVRTALRASRLMRAPDEELDSGASGMTAASSLQNPSLQDDEAGLLELLRRHERALPAPTRTAFHAAVIATRDALRASAHDATLDRDTFDVRQAAREDLPALLAAYRASPATLANDAELGRQLQLIERRMNAVIQDRAAKHQRVLEAHGRYLETKYLQGEPETVERGEAVPVRSPVRRTHPQEKVNTRK
ncbi:hypothetical protein [Deinococcus aerophilus]|uniref:5-bromo-4-chloroindolyl phosphate hydrolysis protein n=1 Tax=Deinococcus aerophilus TaxID=522488 RepID=A0ABQ2GS99_9DEIO|nr:hypothetical protein [Deinococcus aerophilus]GGM10892.1 hypothetical protein GCM10010841_19200 [Deinococcus aerophilus]